MADARRLHPYGDDDAGLRHDLRGRAHVGATPKSGRADRVGAGRGSGPDVEIRLPPLLRTAARGHVEFANLAARRVAPQAIAGAGHGRDAGAAVSPLDVRTPRLADTD